MAIIAKDSGAGNYEPVPEGLYAAVCCDVIDKGLQETQYGAKHKVQIRWQIDHLREDGKPALAMATYTVSLSEKASLRKVLESWRGKKFTAKELEGFDLELLLDKGCQVQLVHSLGQNGRTFANVQAVVPLGKGVKAAKVTDYIRTKDREQKPQEAKQEADGDDDLPF